jgi:type I restriction enzyme S subunit
MNATNNNIPKLRFPEFSGTWETKAIDSLGQFYGGGTPDSTKEEYWKGNIPWISSSDISDDSIHLINKTRFINEKAVKDSATKIIPARSILMVSRVGIGKFAIADSELCTSQDFTNLVSTQNEYFLAYLFKHQAKKFLRLSQGTSIKGFTIKDIKSAKVSIPSLPEQQKIASFLTAVDDKLQALKKKKAGLERYKKGVTQKFFTQKLRFKDENGKNYPDWEMRKFSDVLKEHKLKSTGNEEVHSVSVHKGVINQIEHLGRSFSAKDTSHYSRALPNDIIYTKSPTGDFPLGIIKQNHIKEDVILSPLYGVFTPETKELGYMLHVYFESPINTSNYLSSIIQKGAKNTINITNDTFLSKKMLLPISKEEQTKIANFLSAIDDKIQQVEKQLAGMEQWKKGLLQKMFV